MGTFLMWSQGDIFIVVQHRNMKSPDRRVGAFGSCDSFWATGGGCPYRSCPPQILSLALGALAIHRPGLEAAFFQPALDLVFGEADIRFDPRMRDQSLLHVRINGPAVNLQQRLSCPSNSLIHGRRDGQVPLFSRLAIFSRDFAAPAFK